MPCSACHDRKLESTCLALRGDTHIAMAAVLFIYIILVIIIIRAFVFARISSSVNIMLEHVYATINHAPHPQV